MARVALVALSALFFLMAAVVHEQPQRIVSLDGTTTEIVAALGAEHLLVGRDDSSTYPASVERIPSVGYQFTLGAEGILSLHPSLVLGRDDAQPRTALQQVRDAGVRVVLLSEPHTLAGVESKIATVATLLGRKAQGKMLIARLRREDAALRRDVAERRGAPARVLVFLAISPEMTLACGPQSGPGAMVALVGAINALPQMRSCKTATPESIIAARPDVIVALTRGADMRAGAPQLRAVIGITQTPAWRSHRLYTFDSLFFGGFGPRSGRALLDLFDAVYRAN